MTADPSAESGATPNESFFEAINRFLDGKPEFRGGFQRSRMPSYQYWTISAGQRRTRHQRLYAYTTERGHGPNEVEGSKEAFWAMLYEHDGRGTYKIRKAIRCRTRRLAKARAYAWFLKDSGKGEGRSLQKAKETLAAWRENDRKRREANRVVWLPPNGGTVPRDLDDPKTGLDAAIHGSSPRDEVV